MLTYLTSIRHPRNSNDYARVWRLFDDTCRSVLSARDAEVQVVVVANTVPDAHRARWAGQPVRFLEVDFPPPSPRRVAATGLEAARLDKGSKYVAGLLHLREAATTGHVTLLDADDFVHRDLAALVAAGAGGDAWMLHRGWWLKEGRVAPLDGFDRRCGTSSVVPFPVYDAHVPRRLGAGCSQDEIFRHVDQRVVRFVLGSHAFMAQWLEEKRVPVREVPVRAAMRTLATGENHSDGQPEPPSRFDTTDWDVVDDELAEAFALPAHQRPPVREKGNR